MGETTVLPNLITPLEEAEKAVKKVDPNIEKLKPIGAIAELTSSEFGPTNKVVPIDISMVFPLKSATSEPVV